MRFSFFTIFQKMGDGLTPNMKLRIGKVSFIPGIKLKRGVANSGIDIFEHYGKDIEGEIDVDTLVISAFHNINNP